MIALINCQPQIVSRSWAEVTLRFPGGKERKMFEEALIEACRTPEERATLYAKKHGIAPSTSVATD